MSLKDSKNEFEKQFNISLKGMFSGERNVKVGKNKITIKDGEFIASVDYTYLNNLNAYGTVIVVKSSDLKSQIDEFHPPYKSNLPNAEYIYCMSTMGEKDGCPLLPSTIDGINNTCNLLLDRLKNVHLPVIFNLQAVNKELVSDVIENPKCYSYPFLIMMLAVKRNGMSRDDMDNELILSEKTQGFNNDKNVKFRFNNEIYRRNFF